MNGQCLVILSIWLTVSVVLADPPAPPMPVALAIVHTNRLHGIEYDGPVTIYCQPSDSPNVVGYNFYIGTNSGNYTLEISSSNTCIVVSNFVKGVQYFCADTAVNASRIQSALSPETTFSGFSFHSFPILGHSTDLIHWTNSCLAPGFYRLGLKTVKEVAP